MELQCEEITHWPDRKHLLSKKGTPFILQSISILDVNIELDHFIEWSCDDLPKGGKTSIQEEVLNVF